MGVVLTDGSFGKTGPKLLGGTVQAAPEHWDLCQWDRDFMRAGADKDFPTYEFLGNIGSGLNCMMLGFKWD
ncbi:MAG: hypothetical protein COV48_09690 [Elusimicrobia bacterium CG11_big_fil_rev_8_21_14_0_20_64_6]|nr:MAG: hypothetical protein COV48_09690 [Elusimicrobia bacterium CG11_big_fil_rev_8_21_14_0_20_64_6]